MSEQIISFKTARLLKDVNFNIKNLHKAYNDSAVVCDVLFINDEDIPAPTQTTLQKWLREKHLCIVNVDYYTHIDDEPIGKLKYQAFVNLITNEFNEHFDENAVDDYVTMGSDTWEEALEEGLYQALLLLKNKIN